MTPLVVRRSPWRLLATVFAGLPFAVLLTLAIRSELDSPFLNERTADQIAVVVLCLLLMALVLLLRGQIIRAEINDVELRLVTFLRPTMRFSLADHRFEITRTDPYEEPHISQLVVVALHDDSRRSFTLKFGERGNDDFFTELVARKRAVDLLVQPLA